MPASTNRQPLSKAQAALVLAAPFASATPPPPEDPRARNYWFGIGLLVFGYVAVLVAAYNHFAG